MNEQIETAGKNTEELLRILVELKKTEMRRTKTNRIIQFLLIVLPTFLIIIFSVYGGIVLAKQGSKMLQSAFQSTTGSESGGSIIDDQLQKQLQNLLGQ